MLVWISAYINLTKGVRSLDVALKEKNGAHEFNKKNQMQTKTYLGNFGDCFGIDALDEEGTRTCKKGSQRT